MPAVGAATSWLYDSPVVEPLRLRRVPLLTACACFALGDLLALRWQPHAPPSRRHAPALRPLPPQSAQGASRCNRFPSMRSGSPSAAGARRSSPPSRNKPRSTISPTALPATSRAPSSAFARFLRRPATRRIPPSSPAPGTPTPSPIRSPSTSTSSPSNTSPRPLRDAAHRRRHPLHGQRPAARPSLRRPDRRPAAPPHPRRLSRSRRLVLRRLPARAKASAPPAAANPRAYKSSAPLALRSAAASSPRKPGPPTASSPSPLRAPSAISPRTPPHS